MYTEFEKWLDNILSQELPEGIVAFNFNMYENSGSTWSIELAGTASFDENDEDWACDEVFDCRDNSLSWSEKADWEAVLEGMEANLRKYLERGKYAEMLKEYQGIGIGFVDGDLNIVYKKD